MEVVFPTRWYNSGDRWRLGITCSTCASLFVIKPNDITVVQEDRPRSDGYSDGRHMFPPSGKKFVYYDACCPVCGHTMTIDSLPPADTSDKEVPAETY